MSKTLGFRLLFWTAPLTVFVLWIIQIIGQNVPEPNNPDFFGWFNLVLGLAGIAGVWGLLLLFKGLFAKSLGGAKRINVFFGIGLLTLMVLYIVFNFVFDGKEDVARTLVLPIVGAALLLAIILSLFATGGKKWDQGDNKNVGYKNYHQRKAEEEKNEKK
jgi:uncharacterized membrane protein YuzA (DUF378 family)